MLYVAYDLLVSLLSFLIYHITSRRRGADPAARLAWYKKRRYVSLPEILRGQCDLIWIHAVSAGEVKAALRLIDAFRNLNLGIKVALSSSTPSGLSKAQTSGLIDAAFVMPLDKGSLVDDLIRQLRPTALIVLEAELWPRLFHAAAKSGVHIFMVNMTLSDNAFRNLNRFSLFRRATIANVDHFYVQQEKARIQLGQLGIPSDRVSISGNLKLSPRTDKDLGQAISAETSDGKRHTIVFGNIHPEELQGVAEVVTLLRSNHSDVRTILVPRHFERYNVTDLVSAFGIDLRVVTSTAQIAPTDTLIWLAAMGVLEAAYARSTLAVVMGTFCGVGGHDLFEPLHFGSLTLYGPNIERQAVLHAEISRTMPWAQVQSFEALSHSLDKLLTSQTLLSERQEELRRTLATLQGGANQTARDIAMRMTRR